MMTGEVAELKEETGISENRGENNHPEKNDALEFVRNIREDVEQEERPCSLSSQNAMTKDRSSLASSRSTSSNTPDPGHIEGSLACTSHNRKSSMKRSKRYLPPDEPNEVSGRLADVDSPLESPGLLRNILLTVAVNEAEKERKILKDSETPESLLSDGMSSSCSTVRDGNSEECFDKESPTSTSQNTDKSTSVNYRRSPSPQKENSPLDEKSTKSETFLPDGNCQRVLSYVKRPKSAPVEVTTRCTQTEWSWLEDMKRFETLKTQLQSSIRHLDSADREGQLHVKHQTQQSRTQPVGLTNETKENTLIKIEDSEDDLFKEPTEEFSSSSSDEEDLMVEFSKETFLPSIGPPKILQYVKESVNPPFQNDHPDKDQHQHTLQGSSEDHSCAFCKTEILEKIEISQQISSEKAKPSCPVYHEHIKQQSHYKEDDGFIKDELIDIQPHPPFGTKAARKAAKERAAERAREREIERQKVSGNAVNFYAMTRQMKTLTYSLASTKCMDDGWTVKPLTPVRAEGGEHLEPFDIEINSSRTQQKETFLERFYTNGKRLLVLFPDGTGCCYYPSGNPAVIISSTEKGKFSYILQEDTYEHSRHYTGVLGVFDPTGHGSCYFQQTGNIRMVLTPFGGTYFDSKGEKKKKWFWYNHHSNHVHAPPFQPITFAMTKELSIRCMGQDYIIITYNYGRHTIRFNVGARLKAIAKKIKSPSTEENYELQLKEIRQFVNMVIERVQTTLRFPRSTRINKLPLTKPDRNQSKPSRFDSIFDKDDNATVVVN